MTEKRGRGLSAETFYSICSAHQARHDGCPRCEVGTWHNDTASSLKRMLHKHAYPIWRWWENQEGGATRKRLERIFPGLARKAAD